MRPRACRLRLPHRRKAASTCNHRAETQAQLIFQCAFYNKWTLGSELAQPGLKLGLWAPMPSVASLALGAGPAAAELGAPRGPPGDTLLRSQPPKCNMG